MSIQQDITKDSSNVNLIYLIAFFIGLIAILLVIARLEARNLPYIYNDRTAFFVLAGIGFIGCTMVMGKALEKYGFSDPLVFISSVLGVIITILFVMFLFKINIPFITNDYEAFLALGLLITSKIFLANFQKLVDILGIFY